VEFDADSMLEDEMEDGLVGDTAGVALGDTAVEDDEAVGSSLAGCSDRGVCCVEVPFRALSSGDLVVGTALVTSTELLWFEIGCVV
jgi:hypothetical protein